MVIKDKGTDNTYLTNLLVPALYLGSYPALTVLSLLGCGRGGNLCRVPSPFLVSLAFAELGDECGEGVENNGEDGEQDCGCHDVTGVEVDGKGGETCCDGEGDRENEDEHFLFLWLWCSLLLYPVYIHKAGDASPEVDPGKYLGTDFSGGYGKLLTYR